MIWLTGFLASTATMAYVVALRSIAHWEPQKR